MHRLPALAVVTLVLVVAGSGLRADDAPETVVRYANDRLTVHASKVPADQVLERVAAATEADVRGGVLPHDVTAEFDDVPLSEGLTRLLGTQNFLLKYGDRGRLRAIVLLGGPVAPAVVTVPHAVPTTTAPFSPASLQQALSQHPPIPLSPHLARALGAPQATVDQLLNAALHQDDPGVRSEALRTTLDAIETDPNLRAAFLGVVAKVDDVALGNMLKGMSSEHAEEFVAHVASEAKSSELRVKAASVLQQFRVGRGG